MTNVEIYEKSGKVEINRKQFTLTMALPGVFIAAMMFRLRRTSATLKNRLHSCEFPISNP
jgi:hypothetical protein